LQADFLSNFGGVDVRTYALPLFSSGGRIISSQRRVRFLPSRATDCPSVHVSGGIAPRPAGLRAHPKQPTSLANKVNRQRSEAFDRRDSATGFLIAPALRTQSRKVLGLRLENYAIGRRGAKGGLAARGSAHDDKWRRLQRLKTYKDFPHGMPTTQAETINADLPAFLKA
jgi:hypothetical protein